MGKAEILTSHQQAELLSLGIRSSLTFVNDPRHLVFSLARYKFVSKLLEGYESVLEVGCGDAFESTVVAQAVQRLVCIDSESYILDHSAKNPQLSLNTTLMLHDILHSPMPDPFQAVYSLDVIEHIPPESEERFMENIVASTIENGVLIIGTPNLTAAQYASPLSEIDHVNLKSHESLKQTLSRHYRHVFMFGMNDEVVHTGYPAMCHYLFGLAVGAR